ncbi:MAG: hypothetical protein ACE5HN_01500 [Nitrospiria bacterium]
MTKPGQEEPVTFKVDFHIPENFTRRYATNMLIQHGENEFLISFFETYPPTFLVSPMDVEAKKKIDDLKSVKANCIASIIVSDEKMPSFVKAMNDAYERTKQSLKSHEK